MYVCFLHSFIVMYLEESNFLFHFLLAYQKVKLGVTTVVSNKKVFWKWQRWNQTSMLQNMWFVS